MGVIIGVLVAYSALMTFSLYMSAQEFNELRTKYDDVLAEQKSALDGKMDEIFESAKFISLEAFARVIDENAVVSISSDESAIIRLSMGEKTTEAMVSKIKEYIAVLPSAIKR